MNCRTQLVWLIIILALNVELGAWCELIWKKEKQSFEMNFRKTLLWLILFGSFTYCHAWTSWTSSEVSKRLIIELELNTDPIFPQDANYTYYEEIGIRNPNIDKLTSEAQSPISNKTKLFLEHGFIKSVDLISELNHISIYNCSTSTVMINPKWTYQTEHLAIVHGKLEKLPKNLNVLKKLEKLYLHDNQIEFIEMADLNGLNKLQFLNVHENKIADIRATMQNPVYLPMLGEFYAYKNRLSDISFEHWNTSSLHTMYLYDNQLQIALSFPKAFPKLNKVSIDNNPFNCQWLTSALKELKARTNMTIYDEDKTKCDKNGPPLEEIIRRVNLKTTFPSMVHLKYMQSELEDGLKNALTNVESLSRNQTTMINQVQSENELQKKSNKEIDAKLSELSTKTKLQVEKYQAEGKTELEKFKNEILSKEQMLNEKVDKLDKLMTSENINIKNTLNVHTAESNKSHDQLQSKDEQLEDQMKEFSARISTESENLQSKMENELMRVTNATSKTEQNLKQVESSVQQKLESLQKSVQNHEEGDFQELRQQIEQLELVQNDRLNETAMEISKAEGASMDFRNNITEEIQLMAHILDELQRKMNGSSIGAKKLTFGEAFDKYSVILSVLVALGCLFLMKMIYNSVKHYNSCKRRKSTPMSEIPIISYQTPSTKL